MKNVIAILLIISSIGLFYLYISPTYEEIKVLQLKKAEYDEAVNNSQKIQNVLDELLGKYNSFSPNNLKRLEKLLPSSIDNIRLIIEVDSIASRYNMNLKNVQVSAPPDTAKQTNKALPTEVSPYGTADISFDVSGSYEAYQSFLQSLEKSLRIIDIRGITLSADDTSEKNVSDDRYTFKTTLQTYWLRQK